MAEFKVVGDKMIRVGNSCYEPLSCRADRMSKFIYFGPYVIDADVCYSLKELLEEAETAVGLLEEWIDEQDDKRK